MDSPAIRRTRLVYRKVSTSRGKILCAIIGDPKGKPAVAFHGLGGQAPRLARELKELAQSSGWRIYSFALPNHGGGCKIKRFGFSANDFCDLLIEAVENLGLKEAPMFVGHSMGGQLAILIADRRPDLVARRIFLINPPVGEGWDAKALECIHRPWLLFKLVMELGYDAANEAMGTAYHVMRLIRSFADALNSRAPNPYRRLQASLAVVSTHNTAAVLRRLTGQGFKILIVHGTRDIAIPCPKLLPGCTIIEVNGAYHSWHEQDPFGLAGIFGRWLIPANPPAGA